MNKNDVKIETFRGKGPGGMHRNKTDSCVRATHIPSGINVVIDGRNQGQNKKVALKELEVRLKEHKQALRAKHKKAHRDEKIKPQKYIRTYNFQSKTVKDHRTGKTASLKNILEKGNIDLLK